MWAYSGEMLVTPHIFLHVKAVARLCRQNGKLSGFGRVPIKPRAAAVTARERTRSKPR